MEDKAVQHCAIDQLPCDPQIRTRFDAEFLASTAQTIVETGILSPLLVRRKGSGFVVLDGEMRLRAARIAGLTHVPVIIEDRELSEFEVVLRQLIANGSRIDLDPLDEAKAIHRLMALTKWSAAQVSVKLGKSPGTVAKLLAILKLPASVQQKIADGSLPLTTAYALAQAQSAEGQSELAAEAVNEKLTRSEVIKRVKSRIERSPKAGERRSRTARRERVSIPLGGGRSVAVVGPKLTVSAMIEWLAELLEKLRGIQVRNVEVSEAVKLIAKSA